MVKEAIPTRPNHLLCLARKERGWTQQEVAERIGVPHPRHVTRWEQGLTVPSLHYIGQLCALFERSAHELGLFQEADIPASPTSTNLQAPLPIQTSPLIGREWEVQEICTLLRRSEVRLLTVTGTGGVGKTRLALHVASELSADFTDGVYFISLATISNPDLLLSALAQALGLAERRDCSIVEHLKVYLHRRHLLLLLDNFEQIVTAAPQLVEILAVCSQLKLLVTSRCRLHLREEYEVLLSPLALPDLAHLPTHEDLPQIAAIALFLHQVRMRVADFQVTATNTQSIAEICVRLEGLPLALELAAARIKLFSPQALLARLDRRLPLLTRGTQDAPARQRTLREAIAWSEHLLAPQHQRLFRRLSVFVNGCTLEAIETVCGPGEEQREQIVDVVAALLDQNLLQVQRSEREAPWFWMLETIREYAWECLEGSGEQEAMQQAHALYYLALAEEADLQLKGPQPHPWLERLQREHDNLREALCFLIAHRENETSMGTEMALRLEKALERFWMIGGHVKEGRDLLERTLKRSREVSPSIRGYALCILAILARYQGDYDAAEAAGEESLAIFRKLDDPSGIANALYRLGYAAWMRGDPGTARTYYEESLAISGREQYREQCKDARSETLYYFAYLAFFQREAQLARLLIEESLDLSRELGDQYSIASALNLLGWVSLLQEDIVAARTLQEESLKTNRELGNQRGIAHTQCALGEIAYRMGDFAQARERYEEGLALLMWLDDRLMVAIYLERLASVAVALDEAVWAVYLLSAGQALRQVMGASMTTLLERDAREETLTTLHNLLDEQVFAAIWEKGQAMSPEQVITARNPLTRPSCSLQKREERTSPARSDDNLSIREIEVLRLIAHGYTNAQIAEQLIISPRTVHAHVRSLYSKLGINSRSAATRYAIYHHFVE